MRRFVLALAAILVFTSVVAPQPAEAASFLINVNPGGKELPLATPAPMHVGEVGETSDIIWSTLQRDLDMSGYFTMIDPAAYIEKNGDVEPGSFQLSDWRVVGAAAVAKTRLTETDDQLIGDVFVYDVGTGEKIAGKRFTGTPDEARRIAHKMADAVLNALTGQTSFFGTRVAAVGSKTGNKEIYVMDFDGHGKRAVTRNGSINLSPAWSPDGQQMAWTSYKRNNPDLYIKDLGTGQTRTLSAREGINTGAAFSPDGAKVAITRSTDGDADIYIVDAKTGKELQRVTTGGGIDVSPAWSPDGSQLAFSSERSGGSQIFMLDVASGKARRISHNGDFNFDPVFSPAGDRLAFVGRSDSGFNIFTVGVDGKSMRAVTQDQGDNEDPSWSPDGRYLMFSSTRNGRSEIWLSTADGRHQSPVTPGESGWTQPTWSPER